MSISEKLKIFIEQELRNVYANASQSDILLSSFDVNDVEEYLSTRTKVLLSFNVGLFTITQEGAELLRNLLTDALLHNKVHYTRVSVKTKVKPNYEYIVYNFDETAVIRYNEDLCVHMFYSPGLTVSCPNAVNRVKEQIANTIDIWKDVIAPEYVYNETIFDVLFGLHGLPEIAHVLNYLYMRMVYQVTSIAHELISYFEPYIQYLMQTQTGLLRSRFKSLFDRYQQKRLQVQILLLYGLLRSRFQPQIVQILQEGIKSKEDRLKIELLLSYTALVKLLMEHIEQTCYAQILSGTNNAT